MEIRIAEEQDLPEVAKLELCFAFPLSLQDLQKLHQDPLFSILIFCDSSQILGHCVLYQVCDEAQITSFAIRKDRRREGIGTAFLQQLLRQLKQNGSKVAYLEVRESNQAARELYRKNGFTALGRRKNFYDRPTEDGITMAVEL